MNKTIEEQTQDTFDAMIRRYVDNALIDVHTFIPGIVDSFDPIKQIAKVQPTISRIFIGDVVKPLPLCINVPVMFPRAGSFAITFPVKHGDECALAFSERAIDTWMQSGGVQKPLDRRKHDLSDAIAILGLYNQNNVIGSFATDGLVLRNESNNTRITIKDGEIVVDAPLMTVNVPETEWNGNITHTGNMNRTGNTSQEGNFDLNGISTANDHVSSGKSGATHTHTGNLGVPTSPPL